MDNQTKILSIDANKVPNEVLKRLIKEVQHDHNNNIRSYNRTHNRHNRTLIRTPQPYPDKPITND